MASGLAAAAHMALAAKQLHLRYQPEFATKIHRPIGLPAPTAVRFRRPNVAKQNTLNADKKFGLASSFSGRLLEAASLLMPQICVVAILCFRFSSWPPPIIGGGRYEDMI